MRKKSIISSAQLLFMTVGSALVFPYTFMPILNAPPANQDVWIVLFLTIIYIFLIGIPLIILMTKFRGLNANEAVETIVGKFLGKVAAIIFALFFVFCFSACMLISALYTNLYIFPETPVWALLVFTIIPVSYGVYKGAGTIGRLSIFIVTFVIVTILFFFLLGIKELDLNLLKPILADSTFLELNLGAFLTGARYSEILIFFIFSYYLGEKCSIIKTMTASVGVFILCFFLILIPVLTLLGPEMAKHAWNPYFIYSRHVEAYDFLERVQAINTLAWFPLSLLKLMLYNYMASFILSNVFGAKSHRGFTIPISIFGGVLCLIPALNKSSTIEYFKSDQVFPFIVLPATFVLPLILLLVYLVRRKKINQAIEEKLKDKSNS